MGVDYTAFVAYGDCLLENEIDDNAVDNLNTKLRDLRVEIIQWGGRNYGHPSGHLLMLKETYTALDIGDGEPGVHLKRIPPAMDLIQAANRLNDARRLIGKRANAQIDNDSRGWFAGVWVS